MGWIDTIRSLLGLQSNDSGGTGDTEITVEREPEATAERAVKEPVESDIEADESAEADEGSMDESVVESEQAGGVSDEELDTEPEPDDSGATVEDTDDSVASEAVEEDTPEADEEDALEADEEDAPEAVEEAPETEEGASEPTEEPAEEKSASVPEGNVALTDIKGIGSAYADRLAEAGVEAVDDLVEADAAELSEATDISEKRLQRWIDRAQDR